MLSIYLSPLALLASLAVRQNSYPFPFIKSPRFVRTFVKYIFILPEFDADFSWGTNCLCVRHAHGGKLPKFVLFSLHAPQVLRQGDSFRPVLP
ncbi:MAG TPA: hypothetical protein DEA44_05855 [Firmicutes bacterium]|nr:hypothetical protein [Bacillota bacterium]